MRKRAATSSEAKPRDRKPRPAQPPESVVSAATERDFVDVPTQVGSLGGGKDSFQGVLSRVLGFARAAELEAKPRTSKPTATASTPADRRSALDGLAVFVRSLDAATLDKLRTLMLAGREARALADAHVTRSGEARVPAAGGEDPFVAGMDSLQDLQRGHAIACATQFNLELEVSKWSKSEERGSLDERVWLRFGRELALSNPGEWSCLGALGPGDQLEALYLRRGEERWWSFDSVVDRPSSTQVSRERTQRVGKHHKLVPLPVEAVVGRRCRADRRAVRRAAQAMSARLGFCRASSGDLTPRT